MCYIANLNHNCTLPLSDLHPPPSLWHAEKNASNVPITGATNTCKKAGTIAAATATATADPVIPLPSTICWKDHPEWTDWLIASLLQHLNIRLCLFSFLTQPMLLKQRITQR